MAGSEAEQSQPPARARRGRRRRWCFRLLTVVLAPLLFLGVVELALRVMGVGHRTQFLITDPADSSRWRDNEQFAWRFFPRALSRSSQPILVAKNKPEGARRILVFGGSAAMGDPEPAFGLSRVLDALLSARHPEVEFEVINTAMTAINSHVVRAIARDCRKLDADLWVIYMGNNEVHGPFGAGTVFGAQAPPMWVIRANLAAKGTATGQWLGGLLKGGGGPTPKAWRGLEMFLEQQVGQGDAALQRVYAHFEKNLDAIINHAVGAGVPVILSNVVVNLRDFPPFVSGEGEGSAQSAFETAQRLLAAGDRQAAAEAFQRARDLDTLRLRADSRLNAVAAEVASRREGDGVSFVDAVERFAENSRDGVPGEEFVHEHVHFNFAGNYLLAKGIAEEAERALQLPATSGGWLSEEDCARRVGLTDWHRARNIERTLERLGRPPFNDQVGHEARESRLRGRLAEIRGSLGGAAKAEALQRYREMLEEDPEDWIPREQCADLLESTGDFTAAADLMREVSESLPHRPEVWYRLGTLRNRERDWEAAEIALRRALELQPRYPQALNSLGICRSHQGAYEESYDCFRRAVELMPWYGQAYYNWGLVLAAEGEPEGALECFRKAIAANPNHLAAHQKLGESYTRSGDYPAAEGSYREVVRLASKSANAHINLAATCLRQEKTAAAIESLKAALKLEPSNELAQQLLQKAEAE